MKGVVKYALGMDGVDLRELPEPVPKEGECKVKVLAAGVCGSDIHALQDERSVTMPVVLGHEYVGQIVETCGDVGDLQVGDWVTTLPACYSCGTCALCRAGVVTLCRQRKSIGSHKNGAMASYVVVPAQYTYRIPTKAATRKEKIAYALAEPLACVVRGVYERIDVKQGDTVVVSGPGVMGQMAAQVFKSRGAYVILSGLPADREKLELAKRLGAADEAVSNMEELRWAVYSRNAAGADITCDCTGVTPSLDTCTEIIRPMGTHLQLGMFGGKVPFRLDSFFDKEVTYVPSNSSSVSAWKITMELLEKQISLEPFVSMELPLQEWRTAFDAVINKKVYKAVLLPDNYFDVQ